MMDRPLRKLCLLGDYRVGKTRLVCRLTDCTQPPPTFGVHLHYWRCPSAPEVEFALWDAAGRSALDSIGQSFIGGADGFALVADAGDADSIRIAEQLYRAACGLVGPRPAVLLLNKCDRDPPPLDRLPPDISVFHLSAKRGDGVLEAFTELAERVLAERPRPSPTSSAAHVCSS
jgi:GTPase SAR1 family protein